jgi:uncharacterized Zn-finger protein
MSHDRRHDPATPETSHPADNTSSSTPQFVSGILSADSQTWEREPLSAYTTHLLERWKGSYTEDSFGPISAYNSISEDVTVSNGSFIQRDTASLAEPPDASSYASLQGWNTLEPYQNRWPDTVSTGELPYLGIEGGKEGPTSPAMQHSYYQPWDMRDISVFPEIDARMLESTDALAGNSKPTLSKYRTDNPSPRSVSTRSRASSSLSDAVLYCPYEGCSTKFTGEYRRGNLGRHRRQKHDGQGIFYSCEASDCPKSFRRVDARIKHYRTDHPELASGFPVLLRSGSRVDSRKENVDRSDETRGAEYGFSGTTGSSVTTSTVPAADELHYMEGAFSPASTLLSGTWPQKSHGSGESVQCDICQKTFGRAAELRRHNMSIHNSNTPEFYCEVPGCPRYIEAFARKDKLRDHMDKKHGAPTTTEASEAGEEDMQITYPCPEDGCDKIFDHKSDLLRHQRTHTAKSERKHKCLQCDESFLYPKDLKRHEATHLNDGDKDKPSFYCEVALCEYGPGSQGFSRKDALLRHIKNLHPDYVLDKKDT